MSEPQIEKTGWSNSKRRPHGPCFRAGLLAFAPRLTEACSRHEDKAKPRGLRIYILGGYAHASPQNCSILRTLLATYMGEGFGGSRFRVLYGGEIHCRFYGNLTPCGSTLWIRVKRHVIHHWLPHFPMPFLNKCRKSAVHRSTVRSNASSKIPTELRGRTRTSTTHTKHKRSA